jgi:transcriptional regulator with GAF, ATPase, and Fis domain
MTSFPDISREGVSHRRLAALRNSLAQIMGSWTVKDYQSCLMFFVRILPEVFGAERCTVFIIEMETEKICSIYGTGIEGQKIEPPREGSIVGGVITSGRGVVANDLERKPGYHAQAGEQTDFVTRNMICAPIGHLSSRGVSGAIQVLNKGPAPFDSTDLALLEEIAGYLSLFIETIILNREILRLSRNLSTEVSELDRYLVQRSMLIAESEAMREIVDLAGEIGNSPVNVLLQGENGTGKELVARLIHELSDRRDKPFVAVNCAAIPENLLESEFFGYEKGAFTGADRSAAGRFEAAEGGTLFLDEIADLPMAQQPKFLRALEEGEGSRLGSNTTVPYDFRVISATNKNLAREKEQGRFREDLYFRLFSIEIDIPPLRKRRDDILPMARNFLAETNRRFNKSVAGFAPEVLGLFETCAWPGNVRQLKREIERLVALTRDGEMIRLEKCSPQVLASGSGRVWNPDAESGAPESFSLPAAVRKVEEELIGKAMAATGGNKSRSARLLGITRQGLLKKIKRLHLDRGTS